MLWCAPQIRAKRLYCFSSVSPFVLLCLKGVGGRERKERGVESDTERERMSHEQVASLSLLQHGVLVKHSLVGFALCFRTARVMSSGGWSQEGCQAVMWIISDSIGVLLPSSPSLFPAFSSLLQQSRCLQLTFNWEHFDSAGCEA